MWNCISRETATYCILSSTERPGLVEWNFSCKRSVWVHLDTSVRCIHGFIENVRCESSFDMPDKHVSAPRRYRKFSGQELRRQRGIAKSANIPKFSHHPPSYLPSLRLFPRLLTPAGDFCSQREVFPVYITLAFWARQPTLLGLHPPKTLVRVPGIWNRRNKSNKYSFRRNFQKRCHIKIVSASEKNNRAH